jgi:23S rRNA (adenine2030-N6)-methyltransferase
MYSYRHAFHAGNHADVLKHLTLIGALRHLLRKPGPLTLIDTHAGAGRYKFDSSMAADSGEAQAGVLRPLAALPAPSADDLLADYRALLAVFNPAGPPQGRPAPTGGSEPRAAGSVGPPGSAAGRLTIYPGSPLVMHHYMTQPERLDGALSRDQLHLYEMHPSDSRVLLALAAGLPSRRRVHAERADGFAALRALLPPKAAAASSGSRDGSRRALVLIDPSYEIKSDYTKVEEALQDALRRFATGVYLVWYPIIGRMQAHQLPRRLKTLARQAGRDWLHATLNVGHADMPPGQSVRGLSASGMFVVNPPYPLAEALRTALPTVLAALGQGPGQDWLVETEE